MKLGVIDSKGTGCRSMLLMVLSAFRDLNLEPVITPSGSSSTSIYHYLIEVRDLYYLNADNNVKIIGMIRDPRSVVCDENNPVDFNDYRIILETTQDLMYKCDIMWVRYEQLVIDPILMQDAVGNWLYFKEHYKKYFINIANDYHEIGIPFVGMMVKNDISDNELNLDISEIDKWQYTDKKRLSEQIKLHPELVEWVRLLGYEKDDNWTLEL